MIAADNTEKTDFSFKPEQATLIITDPNTVLWNAGPVRGVRHQDVPAGNTPVISKDLPQTTLDHVLTQLGEASLLHRTPLIPMEGEMCSPRGSSALEEIVTIGDKWVIVYYLDDEQLRTVGAELAELGRGIRPVTDDSILARFHHSFVTYPKE